MYQDYLQEMAKNSGMEHVVLVTGGHGFLNVIVLNV
jgi:hypothetical protein